MAVIAIGQIRGQRWLLRASLGMMDVRAGRPTVADDRVGLVIAELASKSDLR